MTAPNFLPIAQRTAPFLDFTLCSVCHEWSCCKKEGVMSLCELCTTNTLVVPPAARPALPYGSPHADYRQFRPSRHFKLRLWGAERGSAAERDAKLLFHGILKEHFDTRDYPINPFFTTPDATHPVCSVCQGFVWYSGTKEPKFLRKLAHQVGLRIAMNQWRLGSKCGAWEAEQRPTVELVGGVL